MKKYLSLLMLLLGVSFVCKAQLNLCVYSKDGEITRFLASNVDSVSFVVPDSYPVDPANVVNNHEYVDLGLSVRWATCNIGANYPGETGDYFAWGEIEPKVWYSWSTYKWSNGNEQTLTKYCLDENYGIVDNKITLEVSDDVARMEWGDRWRMPTQQEFKELLDFCTLRWIKFNSMYGYEVTSNINGNKIFLPLTGYMIESELITAPFGYYWCSTLDVTDSDNAMQLGFTDTWLGVLSSTRMYGQPIRPVLP